MGSLGGALNLIGICASFRLRVGSRGWVARSVAGIQIHVRLGWLFGHLKFSLFGFIRDPVFRHFLKGLKANPVNQE